MQSHNIRPLPADHPSRKLFDALKSLEPYPKGIVPVPEQISGTSFFPGGSGLWREDSPEVPEFPRKGIMVVGQDFDTDVNYEKSRRNGRENVDTNRTWKNMRKLFRDAAVPLHRCSFTNALMGLRHGGGSNTGPSDGWKDPGFEQRCMAFFMCQVRTQRPKVIVTLGDHVPKFIGSLAMETSELRQWALLKKVTAIDAKGLPFVRQVSFRDCPDLECCSTCLVHPSYHDRNVERRAWNGWTGHQAEVELLKHAMSVAGFSQS